MIQYSFLGYMIATSIVMIVCLIAYRLLMENKTRPCTNRLVIMLIYGISFLVPLIASLISGTTYKENIEVGNLEFNAMAGNVTENNLSQLIYSPTLIHWLNYIYLSGIGVSCILTVVTIIHLLLLSKRAGIVKINNIKVHIHHNKKLSSFSWLNKIFLLDDAIKDSQENLHILLGHEKAHLEKGHWIDLVLAQAIIILQWFNPAAWYLKKELQRTHEYEADEAVLAAGVDKKSYQMLLIQNISRNRYSGLTDGLNNCSLKKRIMMMEKTKFKKDWLARGIAVCVFAIFGGFIIHIPAVSTTLASLKQDDKTLTATAARMSDNVVTVDSRGIANGTYKVFVNGKEISPEEMEQLNPNSIASIEVSKDAEPAEIKITLKNALVANPEGTSQPIKVIGYGTAKKESHVYVSPENIAEYEGGELQLMKDLSKIVQYPQDAYKAEIQGKVVVRFVVNTDGTISDCQVANSAHPLLDEAAITAVENLPGKWEPAKVDGKPVASEYNLPVIFKLSSE